MRSFYYDLSGFHEWIGAEKLISKKEEKISALAAQVLALARDSIMVNLRFLNMALSRLTLTEQRESGFLAVNGTQIFYDPVVVLKMYKQEPNRIFRIYLHMLFHCIFSHSFQYDKMEQENWDLAADIAVENAILEMDIYQGNLKQDEEARAKLRVLKEDAGALTAERVYRYFKNNPLTENAKAEYRAFFKRDEHLFWKPAEELAISEQDWKKISERVKADLKSFSKARGNAESIEKNLNEATRERYDYAGILRRFTVMGEEMKLSEDEFDYVYYTYGLSTYGNRPLIEPLEYRDVKRVKEFVIAIDTSASCRGEIVRAFIQKTYSILKNEESFFRKMNVHIIQCDSEVQSDVKITSDEEFDEFMKNGKLKGFGSTDFRPVFDYVEKLRQEGEFENLKGLIYFTDGYGVYPERMPDYEVIFAFLQEDDKAPLVPPWAVKTVLSEEELER
ncbi:MAG: hypothetical protein GX234_09080 [Clostridiales bacterium]|nr:hypothetical protein [Clostridiales bacterium]